MNSYTKTLLKGLSELDAYVRREGEEDWSRILRSLIQKAADAPDDATADDVIDHMLYFITDSGPAGDDYSPSLSAAMDARQRRRKKNKR